MSRIKQMIQTPRLNLNADTAADLMSPNPISLRHDASVHDAIATLIDRSFDAAPVIDENGRAVGVVTVTDILVHDREYVRYLKTGDMTPRSDLETIGRRLPEDFGIEVVDRTSVEEIMTPTVFTVSPDDSTAFVIRKMLELNVHHLFVADTAGVLIGVISTCDILRRLG
jgi:CBS-domain-containing membrane protein